MEPASSVQQVDTAFIVIIGISLVLLALITGVMIYFVIRYRRSRNPEPSDIRGDWRLEAAWTVIPALIALGMFYIGWDSYLGLRTVPKGALEVQVIGQQYSWVFIYPNEKVTVGELVVPGGKAVKLNIGSEDVLHSLYIPAFRVKVDAVPGMETYAWFQADRPGTFTILCAEFCGEAHADMTALLRIVPEEEYLAWLEQD
jgi:cytochrome c oxidase subunit 2